MGKCNWAGCERASKTVLTFIFSHIGLCALVAGYSIAGGFLFRWLEQKTDMKPFNSTDVRDKCIDEIISLSDRFGMLNEGDVDLWRQEMLVLLKVHDENVTDAILEERYDKTKDDLEERWSIINALFYCVTVITTIGYGHISPRTTHGRIVTIVYSLFGIPLMLLCLNNIGDSMATAFRFAYRRIFCSTSKKNFSKDLLINSTGQREEGKSTKPWQPHASYQPRRRMLISPPISATIHRGSDHPASKSIGGNSKSSPQPTNSNVPSLNLSTLPSINEIQAESIISECASYETAGPNTNHSESVDDLDSLRTSSALPFDSTHSPSPSPFSKDSPSLWADRNHSRNLLVPEEIQSSTPTRTETPLSRWCDSVSSRSYDGTTQNFPQVCNYDDIKWSPHYNGKQKIQDKSPHKKVPAGKTLVVYNTLSGDALKEQSRIQRKLALAHKAKHGTARNESTTVFTDPISGQPVNGDMLGLNYRPIEPEPSDRDTRVPMTLVLAFVSGYLGIGAILFSSLETWTFLDALYFSFTTLSTIGFGDLVPGNLGFETREAQLKMVALALYVLIGLAVLAMSFSLVQEEVVLKCKAVAQYIGLKEE